MEVCFGKLMAGGRKTAIYNLSQPQNQTTKVTTKKKTRGPLEHNMVAKKLNKKEKKHSLKKTKTREGKSLTLFSNLNYGQK